MYDKKHWTDKLPSDVYSRLCACQSMRSDLSTLVNVKWAFMIEAGKKDEGFTKEDALVSVLELLDCNNQFFDLSRGEYDALCRE